MYIYHQLLMITMQKYEDSCLFTPSPGCASCSADLHWSLHCAGGTDKAAGKPHCQNCIAADMQNDIISNILTVQWMFNKCVWRVRRKSRMQEKQVQCCTQSYWTASYPMRNLLHPLMLVPSLAHLAKCVA